MLLKFTMAILIHTKRQGIGRKFRLVTHHFRRSGIHLQMHKVFAPLLENFINICVEEIKKAENISQNRKAANKATPVKYHRECN